MSRSRYVFEEGKVKETTEAEWLSLLSSSDQATYCVCRESLGGVWVSTIFLFMDHGHGITKEPILFETMAFPNDSYSEILCERYSTVEEAVKGHEEVVAYLLDNRLHFLVVNGLYIAKEREVVYKNPYIYGND